MASLVGVRWFALVCSGRDYLQSGVAVSARNVDGREEDLEDLARWGIPYDEAARRVGLTVKSLQKWIDRNRPDLAEILVDNSEQRGLTVQGAILVEPPRGTKMITTQRA